jgi:gliding motility-associated-like protein
VLATVTGQNITCGGGSDGSLLAPGPPDYQFLWNTGQSGPALSGLTAGTYTVTVTNSNNCTATAQLTLIQPPVLTVTTTNTPLNCNNIPDGTATAAATGGTGAIQYLWSVGQQTTAAINTLPAGTYTVTVTDTNLCTATAETTVLQPEPLFFIVGTSQVKCNGDSTGAIDISTFGGTPGYNYLWSTGAVTEDLVNLLPGIYAVTITDLHGCTVKIQGTVTEPAPLLITAVSSTVTGCDQESGTATVTVTGGTPPWSALWSDGQAGFTATALGTGIYAVTVTDVNGCQTDTAVTVEGVPPIDILYNLQHISCFGASDGVVYLEGITGGAGPPYFVEGVEIDSNMSFVNLSAGTYTWSVTDGGNCSTTITGTITEPPPFSFLLPQIIQIDFGQQVLLEPQVNGFPATPITWQWTPPTGLSCDSCASTMAAPFQTTQYQLTGTDANGCTATDEVRINVNRNCDIYIANVFTPQQSGVNDLLIINAGICVKRILQWQIFDRWGELVFSQKDFLPNDFSNAWDGRNRRQRLENGVYTWYARYELLDGTTGLITGDVTILD